MKTSHRKTPIILGRGVLNWPRGERVCDRYGLVTLSPTSGGYNDVPDKPAGSYVALDAATQAGKRGRIVAVVLEARESNHIGDLFRGISPSTPNVGEEIALGEGTLFYENAYDDVIGVGVKPDQPRDSDWMNPRHLYRCHDQTVELRFVLDTARKPARMAGSSFTLSHQSRLPGRP